MRPRARRRGGGRDALALLLGLALVGAAALAPAGLDGRPIPAASIALWAGVFLIAVLVLRALGMAVRAILRRLFWLLPLVALLALPAALLMPPGLRGPVVLGLASRALAAASVGLAIAERLGPSGLVRALRVLRVPPRLVTVLSAALGSLAVLTRQVRSMSRAREARRPARGPWSLLVASPGRTARAYGRLTAALLLRALERAEALDRARRARGTGES